MRCRSAVAVACALALAACAPKRLALPSGPGVPSQGYEADLAQATAGCSGVKTLTAALNLSGRVGRSKLRGRIDAGFSAPASVRLEGVAPFGRPVFVLVAREDDATLVLPRDGRVLRGAQPADIVEALAGVPLGAAELRAVVAGCGLSAGVVTAARTYEGGWLAVDAGQTTVYLRQVERRWRVIAATRGAITVDYANFSGGRAYTIHVRTTPAPGAAAAELTLVVSQLEINVPLDRGVFAYDVPADWTRLTLDELRRAGPLGDEGRR